VTAPTGRQPPWLCIPNISEGRNVELLRTCARGILGAGARLLDVSRDPVHHRAVVTLAGDADQVVGAIVTLFAEAMPVVDLRTHTGVHPRMGAVDVVPVVPIGGAPMREAIDLARRLGAEVGAQFAVPVFLYAEAATHPSRRRLEDIRRGQFEGLADKMRDPAWRPDYGPSAPHPTAGASAIGARRPLVAFNVSLATDRLEIAKAVARAVRERTGGLPAVKALGVPLDDRGCVQVTMNLTDIARTSMQQAFERVRDEAARHGVAVRGSEIVGLVPASAIPPGGVAALRLERVPPRLVLEQQLAEPDLDPNTVT
jgi:glutamate formiminotransferase